MGDIFSSERPIKEVVRENQRMIKKAIRELEKEVNVMKRNEKQLISDIKTMAGQSQMNSARIMAKDLVRTRQYIEKFIEIKTHLNAVSLRLQVRRDRMSWIFVADWIIE